MSNNVRNRSDAVFVGLMPARIAHFTGHYVFFHHFVVVDKSRQNPLVVDGSAIRGMGYRVD